MQMFTYLRVFGMAKEYISGANMGKKSIMLKQAEWSLHWRRLNTCQILNFLTNSKIVDLESESDRKAPSQHLKSETGQNCEILSILSISIFF
ncbi:hypothetical protein BpHYR1_022963 [Brachionus plicatilis]|uniref:Uncharacterized protein n=1 Tax=Brachionus plicatilis TaxID=10195 RepID=A0A3M7RA58_BRAPC|nr:hypothetical protein BpHYR1_022963 [Brachionus plicatilis]